MSGKRHNKSIIITIIILLASAYFLRAQDQFGMIKEKIIDPETKTVNTDSLEKYYLRLLTIQADSAISLFRGIHNEFIKDKSEETKSQISLRVLTEGLIWKDDDKYYEETIQNIFDGIEKAIIQKDHRQTAHFYYLIGRLHTKSENYNKAYHYLLQALEEAKKANDIQQQMTYNIKIGQLLIALNLKSQALDFFRKNLQSSQQFAEEEFAQRERDIAIINLMKVFHLLNIPDSVAYYQEQLKYPQEDYFPDWHSVMSFYTYMGDYYLWSGDNKSAFECYEKTIDIYIKYQAKHSLGDIYTRLAYIYELEGQHYKQLKNNFTALTYRKTNNSSTLIGSSYANIANSYSKLKNYDSAIFYLHKAYKIHSNRNRIDHYLPHDAYKLYEVYNDIGNTDSALKYYILYNEYSDSISYAQNQQKVLTMNYEWQHKEKQLQLGQLKKETQSKGYVIVGLILLFILVMIIILLIVLQYRQRNRQYQIELRDKITRSQLNPHFIFNALIAIQSYVYQNRATEAGAYIAKFAKLMRLFLNNSRVDFISLENEIETLTYYLSLQSIRFREKLSYTLTTAPEIDLINTMIPPGLAQPFIENAIEHGIQPKEEGGNVDLKIFISDNSLCITVTDDGIGIKNAKKSTKGQKHLSLSTRITQERIDNINKKRYGKKKILFTIANACDDCKYSGTRVLFKIPLNFVLKRNKNTKKSR